MHSVYPLTSRTSSYTNHPSHNSWWNHTVKSCWIITLEKIGAPPTENYAAGLDFAENQVAISQQHLRSRMFGLWIKNYTSDDAKGKLRAFRSSYTLNTQYYGSEMFFVIVKMVRPDKCTGWSDIKSKLGKHEDVPFKTWQAQVQPTYCGMGEWDLHFWGNLFRNREAVI